MPSAAVIATQPGSYRIAVAADGTAQVTVRSGALIVKLPSGDNELRAGMTADISGSPDTPNWSVVEDIPPDDFDEFVRAVLSHRQKSDGRHGRDERV